MDKALRDRAVEWVNENCDLDGIAYDAKITEVMAELADLDWFADQEAAPLDL